MQRSIDVSMYGLNWEEDGVAKFKVGDRVRVVKDGGDIGGSYHGSDVGDETTISIIHGTEWFIGDNGWGYFAHEIELAAPDCAGRKVEQDNEAGVNTTQEPKPKFKAGDRVVYKGNGREAGIIKCVKTKYGSNGAPYSGSTAYDYEDGGWDYESSLVLAAPVTPCIVASVNQFGAPMPSHRPHVHGSVADATTEAERLARNNPGQEFAVYQRVVGRKCEVSYEMKEVA